MIVMSTLTTDNSVDVFKYLQGDDLGEGTKSQSPKERNKNKMFYYKERGENKQNTPYPEIQTGYISTML